MNVVPGKQRGLIGATLVKAMFERRRTGAAVLLLVRAGHRGESVLGIAGVRAAGVSRGVAGRRSRVHIFWQRRIRAGDTTTPYWFPRRRQRRDPRGSAGLPDPAGDALGAAADGGHRPDRTGTARAGDGGIM
jgi:hypothetical protein